MSLFRAAPSLGFHPDTDDLDEARRLWPFVREMIDRLLDDGRDYLIEGTCLLPADVAAVVGDSGGRMRSCFLGYAEIAVEQKVDLIAVHAGGPQDWLSKHPAAYIRQQVERSCAMSVWLRDECRRLGLAYFDTGPDHLAAIEAAGAYLVEGRIPSPLAGEGGGEAAG